MSDFSRIQNSFILDNAFSQSDKDQILNALKQLYDGSPTARNWMNIYAALYGNTLIKFLKNEVSGGRLPFGPAQVNIDLQYAAELNMLDNNGNGFKPPLSVILAHELLHAQWGTADDVEYHSDYRGSTVRAANEIHRELGVPERNSYKGANFTHYIYDGFAYTDGNAIDRSMLTDADWDSSPAGDSRDLLIGSNKNNILLSGQGTDYLWGNGGNDTLDGGDGADKMYGGMGDDTYLVEDAGDVVSENANEGTDTVETRVTYTLAANVENLTLSNRGMTGGPGGGGGLRERAGWPVLSPAARRAAVHAPVKAAA